MKELSIDKNAIGGITISQEIRDNEFMVWKNRLLELGFKSARIHHSTLSENQRWLACLGIT